jgi:hypothetical protein
MIELAEKIYAFSYLLKVGSLVAVVCIAIGFCTLRAIRRRIRTRSWIPAIGDRVITRSWRTEGTVEEIDGSCLTIGYYSPNNLAKNYFKTDRSRLFFESRPARRRQV